MNTNKILMQLFIRDNVPNDFGENVYMVCGLVKFDKPQTDETVHIYQGEVNDLQASDVSKYSQGNNLDGVMRAPIFRKFK